MKLLFIALLALSNPFFTAAQAPEPDEIYITKDSRRLCYLNTKSFQASSQASSLSGAGESQLIEFWTRMKYTADEEFSGKIYKAPEIKAKWIANCTQMTYIVLSATAYTSTGEAIETETRSPYSEIQDASPGTMMAEIIEAACRYNSGSFFTTAPAPEPDEIHIIKDYRRLFYLNTKSVQAPSQENSLSIDAKEGEQLIEFWTRMKYTADEELDGKIYKAPETKAKYIANCARMTYIVLSVTFYTSTGEAILTKTLPYSGIRDAAPDTAIAMAIKEACRIYNNNQ